DYQNMNLESERMRINMDSSTVYATGAYTDSTNTEIGGKPVFVMGQDKYENDTIKFNFKSKKGLIQNVRTEQEDGFLYSKRSKRTDTGEFYLEHGTYTTCDAEHPDFYISLSRAKVRPGKDVVFGPAYLVVCDVPLPLAIPYGFFPFTKSYSSGFIMPSYGDESTRGFYLRDGGYYFAINDKWDLKLLGEIYTKGSWGISAASNYRKRYKYSGSFLFSYQNTKNGEKGMPDYTEAESFKLQWSHRQDSKANPYSSLSASVNFATSNFERNNLTSLYNPQSMTQSTRTSSINYSTTFSSIGMSLNATANINQNMRDSSVNVTLPDLNISISPFRPFKRKHAVGAERWYEKIQVRYTGQFSNSIHTKEDQFMKSNLLKDWKKGAQHTIPINANFTLFDYINVTPSFNFTDRMYTDKVSKSWDEENQVERADTTYGFYNVYNWNLSLTANTKLYGMWIPNRKLFGDKIQAIRHVFTPQIGFSYAPDFGSARYGYYQTYQRTDENGDVSLVEYSPFSNGLFTPPGKGKTGSISFDVSNNIEMKIKSEDDSTGFKKISIIDELGASMSYNMSSKDRPWSDLSMRLRLKWWKSYTFNLSASFATYAYELDDNGRPYIGTHTEYSKGRFGRFQGMSQQFSVTIDPSKLKKWFGGGDDKEDDKKKKEEDDDDYDTGVDTNIDDVMERGKHGAEDKGGMAETDADGYMRFSMPWSLSIGYGISMRENTGGEFNTKHMRYPYKFSQNLNFSGNIRLSEGWNINFTSGYDFNAHELSMTTASLSRDLHCFNMSCSVVLAPHTSYNFSFRCNASTLTDALKYDKRSGYTNAIRWY
ncbi:MAG: LPS-assembly protein LptD, partial [Prevotella sp.]|nr:LPS-assembly protein LptD [Prevotella sp.]